MMEILIPILLIFGGFGSVFLFCLSSWRTIRKKILYGRERLDKYLTVLTVSRRLKAQVGQQSKAKKKGRKIPFSGVFETLASRRKDGRNLEKELLQANIPLKPGEFLAIQAVFTILATVLAWAVFDFVLAIAAFALGMLIPGLWVKYKKGSRVNKFNSQLTDTLVTMANSLRSGYSFFQAMELISQEGQSPMKDEFARTLKEINLGISLEEAFEHLLARVESKDLELIVTAVQIQRQVGGNLAEVLEKISSTIRERVRLQGEIRVLTAQGRISGLIISLLPVALALFLQAANPEYLSVLFKDKLGILMVCSGIVSEIIGIFAIRAIVKIEV